MDDMDVTRSMAEVTQSRWLAEQPLLYTVEEAAGLLRIGRTLAYELVQRFESSEGREGLPAVRVGHLWRVPREVVLQILLGSRTVGTADHSATARGQETPAPRCPGRPCCRLGPVASARVRLISSSSFRRRTEICRGSPRSPIRPIWFLRRLVLVGDHRQLQAVGRGGLFAELCANGRVNELELLHRFTHHWEATVLLLLRSGDPRALDAYEAHDRIIPDSLDAHLDRMATTWIAHHDRGETVALVASTNDHVDAINRAVQAARIDAGHLDGSGGVDCGR